LEFECSVGCVDCLLINGDSWGDEWNGARGKDDVLSFEPGCNVECMM
jgi:hypothetical protein